MKRGRLSLNAQVGIGTDLFCRFQLIFAFLFVFSVTSFSAQQINSTSEPLISVVGGATIYSKDPAFNKQISNNKNLQDNLKIEVVENNDLRISAKSTEKKDKPVNSLKKNKKNIVVIAKEEKEKKKEKEYKSDLPKKEVEIKINSKDVTAEFLSNSSNGHICFIPPNNDSSSSKFFVGYHSFQERISVKFPSKINYYYKNRNLKQQISIYKLSVRPPPVLFL